MNTPLPFRLALAALLLLGGRVAQATFDLSGNRLVLDQFRTRGQSADGNGSWVLEGTQARLEGPVVNLTNAKLVYTDRQGETTTITSPSASFNRREQRGHSDAPLRLENRQASVTGVGYDLLIDQHKLFIRKQVHMTFKTQDGSPLDQAVKQTMTPDNRAEGKAP